MVLFLHVFGRTHTQRQDVRNRQGVQEHACRYGTQRRQCRQLVKAEYAGQAEHAGRWGKQGKQGKQGGREGREAGRASRAGRASSNACGFMIGDGILNWIVNRLYQNTIWAHLECVDLVFE